MRDEFWDVPSSIIKSHPYSTLNYFTIKLRNSRTVWDSEKLAVIGIHPLTFIVSGMQPKISAEFSITGNLLEAHHPEQNYSTPLD